MNEDNLVLGAVVCLVLLNVASFIINPLKGKWGMFFLGLIFNPAWWIGALRLAKPDSWWAKQFYSPTELAQARFRLAEWNMGIRHGAINIPLCDAVLIANRHGDIQKVIHLYQAAAESGATEEQYNLGVLYSEVSGIHQDYRKALSWYEKAANNGHTAAQIKLGDLYSNGWGVPQDYSTAEAWYRRAAVQGCPEAQMAIARMFKEGHSSDADIAIAHMWANLATSYSSGETRDKAGVIRDALAGRMTPSQIAKAQVLARTWHPEIEKPIAKCAPDAETPDGSSGLSSQSIDEPANAASRQLLIALVAAALIIGVAIAVIRIL